MAALASAYWVDFATKGDPNGGSRPNWPIYDPNVDKVMSFTNDGALVAPDPLKRRLDLWQRYWNEQN
jgi:para-nitrobenzyl esterase